MAVTLACTSWCKIIAASLHLQGCICHYSLAMLQAKVTAKIVPTQAICIEFPNCDMPKSILQGGMVGRLHQNIGRTETHRCVHSVPCGRCPCRATLGPSVGLLAEGAVGNRDLADGDVRRALDIELVISHFWPRGTTLRVHVRKALAPLLQPGGPAEPFAAIAN